MDARQLSGDNELHQCAKNHRRIQLKQSYSQDEINATNFQGDTPLITAVKQRASAVMKQLIDRKADLNLQDPRGNTALHIAVDEQEFPTITALVDANADCTILNKKGESAIHLAAALPDPRILKILLETSLHARMNAEARNADGETPLFIAVKRQRARTAAWLARMEINLLATDKDGNTPLHCATLLRNSLLTRITMHPTAMGQRNNEGDIPIMLAVKTGKGEVVESLLLSPSQLDPLDRHGNTLLHLACIPEDNTILNFFLKRKLFAREEKNAEGATPLHLACKRNNLNAAKTLALYGATINTVDHLGQTPLMASINNANYEMSDFLLRYPIGGAAASVNAQDYSGTTALHLCAIYNNIQTARLLMEYGANPNIENQNGQTAATIIWSSGAHQLDEIFVDVETTQDPLSQEDQM